jgi:hypothetical protein
MNRQDAKSAKNSKTQFFVFLGALGVLAVHLLPRIENMR